MVRDEIDSRGLVAAEIELARRLEQSISLAPAPTSNGVESVVCGTFRAWFVAYTSNHEANYAMPVSPVQPDRSSAAIADLRAAFAARARTLRIEFVEELWPELGSALQRAGLHLVAREPLMACSKNEFVAAPVAAVKLRALSADDDDADFSVFVRIREQRPTDSLRPVSARAIAAVRQALRAGSEACAIATIDGRPAAVGRCLFQSDGLGEITSIVTLPDFRRRGVAGALVSFLIGRLIEHGGNIAWLNAANERARSVYARLGFRSVGSLVNYED